VGGSVARGGGGTGPSAGGAGAVGANGGVAGGDKVAGSGGTSADGAGGSTNGGDTSGGAATGGSSGMTTSGGASDGTGGAVGGRGTGGRAASGSAGASASTGALIHNETFWKDTSGTPIYSQGGGILQVGDTYYWYGVKYNGAVAFVANQKKNSDTSFNAVTAYSSKDLVNWKHENDVLTASGSGTEVAGSSWLGRLGVAYNKNTQMYVLVSQYQGTAGTGELFATSATPTGNFVFDHIQATVTNVANDTTGDQTVFVDDDGSAYLICSSSMGRSNLYVAPLHAADFLNVDAATRIFGGAGREGNAMFKYNAHYYFCSSDLHGWNASQTYCISATNILGPYGAEFVLENTDKDFSHVTQTGFFVTVNGTAGSTVIFAGDRWADFAGNGIGLNQWCPLTFEGTTPAFQSVTEWSLDAAAGTWTIGAGNNYALNPGFEADRVTVAVPAGWTNTTNLTGTPPFTNVSGGHTANWAWQLSSASDYQASLDQTVSALPNGTYTLSAWVKSTGGQAVAALYAKGFGGADLTAPLTSALKTWTEVSIPNIAVSNDSCQIGVVTTASANQSITLDDFALVRTGD
jgi:Glycosyl hydrolases family 43